MKITTIPTALSAFVSFSQVSGQPFLPLISLFPNSLHQKNGHDTPKFQNRNEKLLSLCGGAFVDTELAVKGIAALHGAQGLMAEVSPSKTAEAYFGDGSPQGSFIVRVLTANVLTWTTFAICLILRQGSVSTFLSALGIVNTLDTLRTFANGDIQKCQLHVPGQVFMLVTPAIATYAGLTDASWGTTYLKFFMGAYILDGIVACNAPFVTAKVFFGPDNNLSKNSLTALRNTGWWILAIGVSGMALAFNVEPMLALGYGMFVMSVAGIDLMLRMNQKKGPLVFWTVVDALAALAMVMSGDTPNSPPSMNSPLTGI